MTVETKLRHLQRISVWVWIITSAFITLASASDLPAPEVALTREEKAWVAQTDNVSMCVDPDWEPFERINAQGQHVGIAADLIQLVAQRTGLKIKLFPVKTWEQSLAASKAGQCQMMSFLNQTPAREQWLRFTDPIFDDTNVIITREEHPFVPDLHRLDREAVALPRGTMVQERIGREYPNLTVIGTTTEPEAMTLVSERKADMTIRSLIVAAYTIKTEGLFNLKISGQVPDFTNHLRIGVAKENTMLHAVLNKGVQSITPQERDAIANRHVSINVQQGVDYTLVWQLTIGGLLVTALILLWNRKLNALNKKLELVAATDRLTGLFNRVRLDEVFAHELQRAVRFQHLFSIVIVDLDLFKIVNDQHGHLVGDEVLVEVANLLRVNTRAIDVVGRWGGEEFLVICPNTDAQGALKLAELLRQRIAEQTFPNALKQTASFGVATYQAGDGSTELVARADAALYEAKNQGRNRVRFC